MENLNLQQNILAYPQLLELVETGKTDQIELLFAFKKYFHRI